MERCFTRFVESPTRENYLAVRRAVLQRSWLPLTAVDLAEMTRLLDSEAFDEVLRRIELLPPSKALSPRVHYLTAEAAQALGDERTGELERYLFVLCLRGILATGDGSQAAPYAVCHASDEHDVLTCLGLEIANQSLVERNRQQFDRVVCSDGREVWFDVTPVVRRPVATRRAARRATRKRRGNSIRNTTGRQTRRSCSARYSRQAARLLKNDV